jgi:hypothetical protein
MPDPRLAALANALPKIPYRIDDDARANLARQLERAKEALPTATIASNAHRRVGHLIESASLQTVPA